jgi:hypothetical protein
MLDHTVAAKKGRYESLCSRSQSKSCDLLQEPQECRLFFP